MAKIIALPYGTLPTRQQFDQGFAANVPGGAGGTLSFPSGDKRRKPAIFNNQEAWDAVNVAMVKFNTRDWDVEGSQRAGEWVFGVLQNVGVDWA